MNKAIVLGTFDLTHYGHYRKFKKLKELGYYTIAGVTTDKFAESYKRKPHLDLNERMENLRHCKWIDEVIINIGGHDSKRDILFSGANVIVHGEDWSNEDYDKQVGINDAWLRDNKIKRLILPYTKGVSTSELIKRVKK